MDGGITWANSIPLMSLLVAVYAAGVAVTKINTMKQEVRDLKADLEKAIKAVKEDDLKHVSEIRSNLMEKIGEIKKDHERSSEDQGKRIGELEAAGRETKVRMELTGRHAVPHEVK